jgi:HTH-type transcriptional regulator, sugar sensing transcriptional regulator
MNLEILRSIGLSENEIKIYLDLLKTGSSTAYEIAKRTSIYRVHVYDKVEQLMDKGLVTHVYQGAKKFFQATNPDKIKQFIEDKKQKLELQEKEVNALLPVLEALTKLPREDTFVEVFKGKEGLKYFLKDIIKTEKDVLITGINDLKYQEALPIFMKQYFRDLRKNNIKERVITVKREGVFLFDKIMAPITKYRYLEEKQFNPTNTFIYGNKVVIVTFGTPITAIMIKNEEIAKTYKGQFEHLWKIASKEV